MRRMLAASVVILGVATAYAAPVIKRSTLSVTMLFDVGGRGDRGFLDAANEGLVRATTELGARGEVIESLGEKERGSIFKKLGEKKADLTIAVGFLFSDDIIAAGKKHKDQKFACVDFAPKKKGKPPANVLGIVFKDEEGAFLAGALAASSSQSGKIGFVGGMDSPVVTRFRAGYIAGAKHVNPKIEVLADVGGKTPEAFVDPAKGKILALKQYDAGADVIFHAAGATGLGVFDAAKEKKKQVIGVDVDQWNEAPGLVLSSVLKRVDTAVFEVVKSVEAGSFKGGVMEMGLGNGGLSLVLDERNAQLVPEATRGKLKEIQADIVAGKIKIPVK